MADGVRGWGGFSWVSKMKEDLDWGDVWLNTLFLGLMG